MAKSEREKGIEASIRKDTIEKIKSLFNGDTPDVSVYERPATLQDILINNFNVEDDFDDWEMNGWQWDFWMYFTHNDKRYLISGDGYYGRTINVSIEDE